MQSQELCKNNFRINRKQKTITQQIKYTPYI